MGDFSVVSVDEKDKVFPSYYDGKKGNNVTGMRSLCLNNNSNDLTIYIPLG